MYINRLQIHNCHQALVRGVNDGIETVVKLQSLSYRCFVFLFQELSLGYRMLTAYCEFWYCMFLVIVKRDFVLFQLSSGQGHSVSSDSPPLCLAINPAYIVHLIFTRDLFYTWLVSFQPSQCYHAALEKWHPLQLSLQFSFVSWLEHYKLNQLVLNLIHKIDFKKFILIVKLFVILMR